jgi:hypothetical protein
MQHGLYMDIHEKVAAAGLDLSRCMAVMLDAGAAVQIVEVHGKQQLSNRCWTLVQYGAILCCLNR